MLELLTQDFALQRPSSLDAGDIHLWFFPQWPATRDAAASTPLRTLLARYLACDPQRLHVGRDDHGKPRLLFPPGLQWQARLEFNLSHSGQALLLGISRGQALGVDLETPRRTRPVLELTRRYFDPTEATALAKLSDDRQQRAFLQLWSCKEAVLKALGRGLAFGLDRVVFELDATGAVSGLKNLCGDSSPGLWQVVQLQPAANYSGALAWRGPTRAIRAFTGSPPAP